jgi:hypothetical protein
MLTVVLLGGLAGAVVAQDGDESGPMVTSFTGVRVNEMGDISEEEWTEEDGVGQARTYKLRENVEWSDPRLPSEVLNVVNLDIYDIGDPAPVMVAFTTSLQGPDGYWTGGGSGFCDMDGDCFGLTTVTGHEAYDGLFAVIHEVPLEDPDARGIVGYEGLIFEGEMPPMPDPVELPAE